MLAIPENQTIEHIKTSLQGEKITPRDLDLVKIPAGGGQTWEVSSTDGGYSTRELDGVIIHTTTSRAYWSTSFEEGGGGRSPDCSSPDGFYGQGDRGVEPHEGPTSIHKCNECPLSRFGSAASGGVACRENREVYLMVETRVFPIILRLPPTSLGVLRKYMVGLASEGKSYYQTLTRFELTRVSSRSGITYSRVAISKVRDLDDAESEAAITYVAGIMDLIEQPGSSAAQLGEPEVGDDLDF